MAHPLERRTLALLATVLVLGGCAGERSSAPAAAVTAPAVETGERVVQALSFETGDGQTLHAWIGGVGDLRPRPLIVEFTPYGQACCGPDFGADYNYLQVHVRGTGRSSGAWSAVGPRDQQDIAEFLEWACVQPWSSGRIGLYGFSASAIAIYNSLHLPLACVEAAALMAGSNDLYRDLIYPGGLLNIAPVIAVGLGVGAPLLQSAFERFAEGELSLGSLEGGVGLQLLAADILQHPTEDEYWIARTQRAGPNQFPVLADTGFYDVESRGPFESYRQLRDLGVPVHLRVFGAHDGFPAGTPGPFVEYRRWFERYLLDRNNGIDREPRVQLLMGHGGYRAQLDGAVTKLEGEDWPLPGTRWQTLHLDGTRNGSARTINDGTLTAVPAEASVTAYPALTSLPTATDPNTTSTIAGSVGPLFTAFPQLMDMVLMEPLSLSYTTPVFSEDVDVVGPATLTLYAATASVEADLYAVIADVSPDGPIQPVGIGRLRTTYPNLVEARTLRDARGEIVQPYPDHSVKTFGLPGVTREYHIEFWPIGNRFQAGHRLRLYLIGAPTFALPSPSLNLVSAGGVTPSRLQLPVLPGSDVCRAMGAPCSSP